MTGRSSRTTPSPARLRQLKVTDKPPPPIYSTDVDDSLGRFDLRQELSLPTYIGPVRVVPYGVIELRITRTI